MHYMVPNNLRIFRRNFTPGETRMDTTQFVSYVQTCLQMADSKQSKLSQEILDLSGCSGAKTRHLLNNLAAIPGVRYLDIGTSEGTSVCAALYENKCEACVVDNNPTAKETRDTNFASFVKNEITLIDKDPFRVNVTKDIKKYNVYLYDGPDHSNLGHYRAIQHYYRAMDDVFVLLIDDWNWPDVRSSTQNALKGMRVTKLFEREINTPSGDDADWWNGLYVAVLEKAK